MSLSLRNDIASRIIDPGEFIKKAQQEADEAVSLLHEKQTKENAPVFTVDENAPIDKKAESVISGIDAILEGKVPEKTGEQKKEDQKNVQDKTQVAVSGSQEKLKTAAAKVISTGIDDDALLAALEKEGSKSVTHINLEELNVDKLNEKVAFKLSQLKKPAAMLAGGAALVGSGYGVGAHMGDKKLKAYINADRKRDEFVANRAFQIGQMSVIQRLRAAMAAKSKKGEAVT